MNEQEIPRHREWYGDMMTRADVEFVVAALRAAGKTEAADTLEAKLRDSEIAQGGHPGFVISGVDDIETGTTRQLLYALKMEPPPQGRSSEHSQY